MMRKCLVLVVALLAQPCANALAEPALRTDYAYSPSFEHISVKQGLAQSTVHVTVQDQRGFLWFGTDFGLNRNDGYRFLSFTRDEDQSNSLQSNIVRALLVDRNGILWVGTFKGLNRIDPETLAIQALPPRPRAPPGDGSFDQFQSGALPRTQTESLWTCLAPAKSSPLPVATGIAAVFEQEMLSARTGT